jgi:gamma-glutamyl-gamma-aminobutyrate hydrolase PuuD
MAGFSRTSRFLIRLNPGVRLKPDTPSASVHGMMSNRRPIIGITSYAQPAQWGAWELPAALVPLYYVDSVEQAGGRALVIPPSEDGVDETLDVLDGIVFSGGIDIDPSRYGAERHPATDPAQERRDAGELRLLEAALERDLPTLAICRGFQLLNVLRGGDLIQHLPEDVGHEGHRETMGVFSEHSVDIRAGTRLASILGTRHGSVQSSHHQGIKRVGENLVATAYADDGSLEGFEDPSKSFALGVLWHPEMDVVDNRLFEALVEEARTYRARVGEREGAS